MTITLSISTVFLILITMGFIYVWYLWIKECGGEMFEYLNGIITVPFFLITIMFYLVWGGIFWW